MTKRDDQGQEVLDTKRAANVVEVASRVSSAARMRKNRHKGGVLWFTGLPSSGKSTLAIELERTLFDAGYTVFVLDGDNMRRGLNSDLGFLPEERTENIRRVGEVAAEAGGGGRGGAFRLRVRRDHANRRPRTHRSWRVCLLDGFVESKRALVSQRKDSPGERRNFCVRYHGCFINDRAAGVADPDRRLADGFLVADRDFYLIRAAYSFPGAGAAAGIHGHCAGSISVQGATGRS